MHIKWTNRKYLYLIAYNMLNLITIISKNI